MQIVMEPSQARVTLMHPQQVRNVLRCWAIQILISVGTDLQSDAVRKLKLEVDEDPGVVG